MEEEDYKYLSFYIIVSTGVWCFINNELWMSAICSCDELGVGMGLVCCDSRGRRELDMTEQLN